MHIVTIAKEENGSPTVSRPYRAIAVINVVSYFRSVERFLTPELETCFCVWGLRICAPISVRLVSGYMFTGQWKFTAHWTAG